MKRRHTSTASGGLKDSGLQDRGTQWSARPQQRRYAPLIRERERAVDTIGFSSVHVYRKGYTVEHVKVVVNTEWFIQWDVPLKVKLVLFLMRKMRIADGTKVYVSTNEIVESLGVQAKSVYTALHTLIKEELIIKRQSNIYELNPHIFWVGLYNKVNKDGELEDYVGDAQAEWDKLIQMKRELEFMNGMNKTYKVEKE